jgi:hypothetical protein
MLFTMPGASAQGQARGGPGSTTAGSGSSSQAAPSAPARQGRSTGERDGVLTFVYTADSSSDKEGGTMFDIRELQADDAQH